MNIMNFFQKLGKSLMLPFCVMPVCGILMGIGYLLCPNAIQGGAIEGALHVIGYFLVKAGSAIIDNMSLFFVIGVSVGMSDDGDSFAVLAGLASWFVITTLLCTNTLSAVMKDVERDSTIYLAFSKINNPTIGMLSGIVAANCYNRFKNIRLPNSLAFFNGKRSVPIITALVSIAVSIPLAFIWPAFFAAMVAFGRLIASLGGIGSGIYAFLNRLLIPVGMHHALNNVFWFDTIGLGDLTNFWNGKTSADVSWSLGMYMSGFFPCMVGGIPGAALAMYHCAKDKKKAFGALGSAALCALLCGLTEPFEFIFMFISFPLYILYSVLYGLFTILTYFAGFRAGFAFSSGLVDLIFSAFMPAAERTWLIIPLSLLAFVVFYFAFRFAIIKFNIETIGREADAKEHTDIAPGTAHGSIDRNELELNEARALLKAVGGKPNVVSSGCCATRLRLELKDSSVVDKEMAMANGAINVICPSHTTCQIIIGVTAQQMLDAFKTALSEAPDEDKKVLKKDLTGQITPHGKIIRIKNKNIDRQEVSIHKDTSSISDVPSLPVSIEDDGTVSFIYTITDPSGLHARPAGQFAQIAKKYSSEITVEANEKTAKGTSVVSLMNLGTVKDSKIIIRIKGDSKESLKEAAELCSFLIDNL